jgi:hypothetical protein
MPTIRRCTAKTAQGAPCRAAPRSDTGLCLWHDPDLAEVAQEARRVGGQKRKRTVAVFGAYDIEGLDSITDIKRVVEIVVTDMLNVEGSSMPRARMLLTAAQVAAKLLETGEFEERLAQLESVMEPRLKKTGGRR